MSLSHVSEGSLQKLCLYQPFSTSLSQKNIENAQHIFPESKVTSSFCFYGPKPKNSSLTLIHEEKQRNLIFKKLEAANVWYHRLEMTKLLIDYQNSWQQLSFSDWWLQLYLLFSAPDTSIHLLTLQTLWTHNKTVSVLLHKNYYSFYWGCIWTSWCLTVQEALCLKPTEKLSLFTYLEVEIDFFKVISTSQLLQQQVQWRSSEDSNFSFRISFLSSHNFLRHDPLLSKCHKCLQGWKCSKCASFVWFIMSKLLK